MSTTKTPSTITSIRSSASPILLTLFSAGLVGCSTSPKTGTATGTAIKGLLEGAEVFIDVNGDGVWTSGVDSAKSITNASGEYSINSSLKGDLVVVTNSSTIDKSSGQILDGITLSAPEGYNVVSVATTITNDLMDANIGMTEAQAQAQVKTLLGLSAGIDVANYNPFAANNVGTATAVEYEKAAQQVMTVINTLATAEDQFSSTIDKQAALNNAFDAFLNVIENNINAATTSSPVSALDFTGSLVNDVIAQYDTASTLKSVANSPAVNAISTAITKVNTDIESVTTLDAGAKELFGLAQVNLITTTTDVASNNNADLIKIDANTDLSTVTVGQGANNHAPTVNTVIADQTAAEDIAFSLNISSNFSDSDAGDTGSYSVSGNPTNLAIDISTGIISGTPDVGDVGTHTITVTRTDGDGETVSDTFELTVTNTNDAPTLNSAIADQTAVEDIAFSLNVASKFSDEEGDAITYSISNAPTGLVIDANTGVITGKPVNADVGVHAVSLTATDSNGDSSTSSINITVINTNDAVFLDSAIANASIAEDAAYQFDASAHFADIDVGDTGTYSMNGGPASLAIDASTGVISGAPTNDELGAHSITVTRTDAGGSTANDTFALTVTNTNDAPIVALTIPDGSTDVATAVNFHMATYFDDVDSGDILSYSMSGEPTGLSINASTGLISGTATVAGTHTITVTATDDSGAGNNSASTIFDLDVAQVVSGSAIKGELSNALAFIDADGDGVWTEGVDSQQVRTDANGHFSLSTHVRGDLVVTTDENTIDQSSGATLTGVTLTAPEGYNVISVATTLANELMDGNDSLSATDAESKVKSLLGIDASIDVTTFNPYDDITSADSIAYEKKAQQVMTVINTLAEAESSSGADVSKASALDNAINAFVNVVANKDTSSGTPMDFTQGIVSEVVAAYDSSSSLASSLATDTLSAITTAIETVNTAIDSVTSLDASSKQLFAAAQVALLDTTKDVAKSGDATRITIDENTDISSLVIIQGSPEKLVAENITPINGDLATSDSISIMGLDTGAGDSVVYTNVGFTGDGSALGSFSINSIGTWTYTIIATHSEIDGMITGQTFSESFKVKADVTYADSSTGEAFKIITVYIDGENDIPTVTSIIADASATEGAAITNIDVSGHFDDVESANLTYSIDDSASDWLSIDSTTGIISGTPNNDQVGTNTITVTATDAQGGSVSDAFDIDVANVNDAPIISSASVAKVDENASVETVVYTAQATDSDATDTITYSLSGEDSGLFTIDASTGVVNLNSSADFETKASYNINVVATDNGVGTLTDSQAVIVTVSNVNEAPVITSLASASIDENVKPDSAVYKATSTDVEGETVLYSLSGTDADKFTIDTSTGEVYIKSSPDFETKNNYSIDVSAQDISGFRSGSPATEKTITINVNDVNEAPVIGSGDTASVAENAPTSTLVYTATASDVDSDTITFSLSGTDADAFAIDASSGAVTLKTSADFETKSSYSIDVIATDDGTGTLTDIQAVTVSITDANDAPVITSATTGTVPENAASSTTVYTAIATDQDADALTYSLAGTDAALFDIVGSSGVVSLKASADYETKATYNFDVIATDDGTGTLADTQAVTVSITDVNDAPVITSVATGTVAENTPVSTIVYTATATDQDSDTITYSLDGTDAAAFTVGATSGEVTLNNSADFETKSSYNIDVIATDDGTGTLTDIQAVTVSITDANDAPVITSATTGTVAENAASSSTVYTAIATDQDADTLTYSLAGTDAALFDIVGSSGVVSLKASANYETKTTYNFDVIATDDGTGTLADTQAVTVSITDVNDAPVITSVATGTVDENASTSTLVYTATASDVDASNNAITFSLSGTDADAFAIDASSGAVTLKTSADFETKSSYSIDVIATDDGTGTLTDTQAVTVSVADVNDAPVGAVSITGKNSEEEVLTATTTTLSDDDGLGSLSYVWMRGGTAIDGATAATYTLTRDDIGSQITVEVSYTDGSGNAESVTSEATSIITEINHDATGDLVITGTAADNSTLTLDTSAIADQNGIVDGSYNYTWQRDGVDIADSNGSTLILTDTDVGAMITAAATFTDGLGATETVVTANGTAAVVDVNDAPTSSLITVSSGAEDTALSLDVSGNFSDIDAGDSLSFSANGLPGSLSISTAGIITGTPLNADAGDHSITVTATDSGSLTSNQTFTLTVTNTNDAPMVTTITAESVDENVALSLDVSSHFSDVDAGDSLTYELAGAPNSLTINGSGVISGTPLQADIGSHSITITATDAAGANVTQNIQITVADVNNQPTGTLELGGNNKVGGYIGAFIDNLVDVDGMAATETPTYTWYRNGVEVGGETVNSYQLAAADLDAAITAKVAYTDEGGFENSITSTYAVNVGAAESLETTGGYIVSTSQTGDVISVSVYADPSFAAIAGGMGAFDASINFDSAGASYVASSYQSQYQMALPLEANVDNGELTIGAIAYPAISDFSSALFSFQLTDLDNTSSFNLTVSGTMGLDGSNIGDAGETLLHVGGEGVNQLSLSYAQTDYKLVLDAMTYDAAEAYAASIGGKLATVDNELLEQGLVEGMGLLADIYNLDSIMGNTLVTGSSDAHVWVGASDAATEGTWLDSDGNALTYTNWANDEPGADGAAKDGLALHLFDQGTPLVPTSDWVDLETTNELFFVVEMV
jgi:VCBS repeat-containing protein